MLYFLLIAYLLVLLVGLIFQRRLLYLPTQIPADVIEPVAWDHGFASWKNSAGQIIGWKMAAGGVATGSVLIVHGNAGCALGRDYLAQPIHAAARVDVFVLEYPGYGARAGSPGKSSILAAAEEAFHLMPSGKPKYIVSESIGVGAATELARKHSSEVAGLALIVPFHNLASVAQKRMWFVPAYFLLLDRFKPEACLKQYRGPVKIIVAGADEILGSAPGIRLHDRYIGPKQLQIFAGALHNEVASQPAAWWQEVFSFWEKNAVRR